MIARLLPLATLAVVALAAPLGCAPPRDDRHALLAAIDGAHDAVTRAEDADAARASVDALEALRVRDDLVDTRDRCAALYAALVAHESASAEASALLDRLESLPRDRWPEGASDRVRGALAVAEAATAEAARARPDCERGRAVLRRELAR